MTRTALQAEVATQFRDVGIRLPLRVDDRNPRLIVDADGHSVFTLVPAEGSRVDARRALLLTMLPNAAGGVPEPEITARLDQHHIAAVQAESRQQAARRGDGSLPQAAE